MDTIDIFQRLAVALAIGLLIGIERGWKERDDPEGSRAAGIRTFALSGLLGGIWGIIAKASGDVGLITLSIAFAAFAGIILVFKYREAVDQNDFGATTIIAALIVFALGAYAIKGDMIVAAAAGVVTAILLAAKTVMHSWLKRLTWEELRASIVLLTMTIILLPILPDEAIGPHEVINPRELWFMTILIAAVSFIGYIAIKLAGEKTGILLSGIAGGLVSSTATTINFARLAASHRNRENLFIGGAVFSGATMMIRVLVVAAIFNLQLLQWLLPALTLAALMMIISGYLLLRTQTESFLHENSFALKNPFNLLTVLQFGGLLAVVLIVSKLLSTLVGTNAIFLFAAVSGFGDVDAITLTMTRLGKSALTLEAASYAILIAVAANTIAKAGIAWFVAGRRTGSKLVMVSLLALATGFAGLRYTQNSDFASLFQYAISGNQSEKPLTKP